MPVFVPNLITFGRLLAVPVIVWLITIGYQGTAFWIFVAAGLSDAADGAIAKRYHVETTLGRYLDPVADKALLVSVYVTLGMGGLLPSWLVILVVFRDAAIIGGTILFQTLDQSMTPRPLMISKINTAVQIVLPAVIMGGPSMGIDVTTLRVVLIYIVALTTFGSGAAYAVTWGRHSTKINGNP